VGARLTGFDVTEEGLNEPDPEPPEEEAPANEPDVFDPPILKEVLLLYPLTLGSSLG
jgi:hypothetical protein